ncbi:MAG: hypothetical protein U1F25_05025 [Rubrivivax sp.]
MSLRSTPSSTPSSMRALPRALAGTLGIAALCLSGGLAAGTAVEAAAAGAMAPSAETAHERPIGAAADFSEPAESPWHALHLAAAGMDPSPLEVGHEPRAEGGGRADRVVKGAPYCAEAVHENVQYLPDPGGAAANRIVRQNTTRLCRDGEGRTRQEWSAAAAASSTCATRWRANRGCSTPSAARRRLSAAGLAWPLDAAADAALWRDYAEQMREWARGMAEAARAHARSGNAAGGGGGAAGAAATSDAFSPAHAGCAAAATRCRTTGAGAAGASGFANAAGAAVAGRHLARRAGPQAPPAPAAAPRSPCCASTAKVRAQICRCRRPPCSGAPAASRRAARA